MAREGLLMDSADESHPSAVVLECPCIECDSPTLRRNPEKKKLKKNIMW
jgi:hypothetical protein